MDDFMTGREVANAIADDREFFQAFVNGELTPFYKGQSQPYDCEASCVTCRLAMENGQPDPFKCDTDPDPEAYTDVVDGYSRHKACEYAAIHDGDFIARRLKRLSFRSIEIDCYFNETGVKPAIMAETFEDSVKLVRKIMVANKPLSKETNVLQCYHLWRGNKYKGWGKSQEEIVFEVTGKEGVTAKQWFQRNVKPLLE